MPEPNTSSLRAVRRRYSSEWRDQPPSFILAAARSVASQQRYRWIAYELLRFHRVSFLSLDDKIVGGFAGGLDSWDSVDAFGRILSGPAWAAGLISDGLVDRWSRSPDRWLRRAALVSTIELSDCERTLAVCARLAADHDDMVEKALSWALRERSKREPKAVRAFLAANDRELGARVKREVRNKLTTGLKNPRSRNGR